MNLKEADWRKSRVCADIFDLADDLKLAPGGSFPTKVFSYSSQYK
jgi:hypothetical protein